MIKRILCIVTFILLISNTLFAQKINNNEDLKSAGFTWEKVYTDSNGTGWGFIVDSNGTTYGEYCTLASLRTYSGTPKANSYDINEAKDRYQQEKEATKQQQSSSQQSSSGGWKSTEAQTDTGTTVAIGNTLPTGTATMAQKTVNQDNVVYTVYECYDASGKSLGYVKQSVYKTWKSAKTATGGSGSDGEPNYDAEDAAKEKEAAANDAAIDAENRKNSAEAGRWVSLGNGQYKYYSEARNDYLVGETACLPDGSGGYYYYWFDNLGICRNPAEKSTNSEKIEDRLSSYLESDKADKDAEKYNSQQGSDEQDQITEHDATQGNWVQVGDKWKFQFQDGSFASGQSVIAKDTDGSYKEFWIDDNGYWNEQDGSTTYNSVDDSDSSSSDTLPPGDWEKWTDGNWYWKCTDGSWFTQSGMFKDPARNVYVELGDQGVWISDVENGEASDSDELGGESGETEVPVISCTQHDPIPPGSWEDTWDNAPYEWWYKLDSGGWLSNCIARDPNYGNNWFPFDANGRCETATGYSTAEEAAAAIGAVSKQKQSTINTEDGNSGLIVTNIEMPELRETNNGQLKMSLEDIHDMQNGKVLRGASNFNLLGTNYKNTKLIFDKETKIYTMQSKTEKMSEICVIAKKVDNTKLDLQVGGTIFRSFPYKQNTDKTIQIHETLYNMLESCYIDINEDGKADVKEKYSYAELHAGDYFIQYVYYKCLSNDNVSADYYTVPIFLFKINGQFIEVRSSQENSGNLFSISIPGVSTINMIKEGFLAKTQPMEIFDGCSIINPVVDDVTEVSVNDLTDQMILECTTGDIKGYSKDQLNNVDIITAYSIGNNVYLTNNINATTLASVTTNSLDSMIDTEKIDSEVDILYRNVTNTLSNCFLLIIKLIGTYTTFVVCLILIIRLSKIGELLLRKKIDAIYFVTFGRLSHMEFNWVSFIIYTFICIAIFVVANMIYYWIF